MHAGTDSLSASGPPSRAESVEVLGHAAHGEGGILARLLGNNLGADGAGADKEGAAGGEAEELKDARPGL